MRGILCTINILDLKEFAILHDKRAHGYTSNPPLTIDIRRDKLSLELVRHELVHAYYYASLVEEAQLKPLQVEEALASMFAHFGPEILKNADLIFKKLKADNK